MPKGKMLTRIVWTLAITGLLGYEGFTLFNSVDGDTLSETVWEFSYDYPLVPLLAGLLMGHFFWQRRREK